MAFDPTILSATQAMAAAGLAAQTAPRTNVAVWEDSPSRYSLAVGAAGLTFVLAGCSEATPQQLEHQPAPTGHQTALEACRESLHLARAERHQDDQGLFAVLLIGALLVATGTFFLGRRSGRKSRQNQPQVTKTNG